MIFQTNPFLQLKIKELAAALRFNTFELTDSLATPAHHFRLFSDRDTTTDYVFILAVTTNLLLHLFINIIMFNML